MVGIYVITFVKRAKNREKILNLLKEKSKTQAELYHESGMYRTHVRRTLLELQGKNLVKCVNPRDRIYKIYQITSSGKEVLKTIKS